MAFLWLSPAKRPKRRGGKTAVFVGFILFVHRQRACSRASELFSFLPKVDHVIKSCNSSLSLFALEDKETEKLDTSLSFVQHGVAHGAQF